MGRRSVQLAADHRLANPHGLTPLYDAAADAFLQLRLTRDRESDALLVPPVHTPERLMRQLRGAFASDGGA